MFLITDEVLYKWRLSQRHIFVLGMLFEIWFGALISQELYQPGLSFPLGFAGINLISLILLTAAWGMFLVTWMHIMALISPRPKEQRLFWLRIILGIGALIFLILFYLGNKFNLTHITGDLILVSLGTVGTIAWSFG